MEGCLASSWSSSPSGSASKITLGFSFSMTELRALSSQPLLFLWGHQQFLLSAGPWPLAHRLSLGQSCVFLSSSTSWDATVHLGGHSLKHPSGITALLVAICKQQGRQVHCRLSCKGSFIIAQQSKSLFWMRQLCHSSHYLSNSLHRLAPVLPDGLQGLLNPTGGATGLERL